MDIATIVNAALTYVLSGAVIAAVTQIVKNHRKTRNLGTLAVVAVASAALNALALLTGQMPSPDLLALSAGALVDAMVAVFGYSVVRAAVDQATVPELDPRG